MDNLNDLEQILDTMISKQKEKKTKTFVARYKGKNLIMRSGKSSWKQTNYAKSSIIQHFCGPERRYVYPVDWNKLGETAEDRKKRKEEFRKKLFELIEIVELTE